MEAGTSTGFHKQDTKSLPIINHVISLGKKQLAKLFTLLYNDGDGGDGTTDYFTMLSDTRSNPVPIFRREMKLRLIISKTPKVHSTGHLL